MSGNSSLSISSARNRLFVGIIGGAECNPEIARLAEELGRAIARRGAVLVCGGRGGVMEATCRGAKSEGGLTIGILPGPDREEANPFVDVAIATGLGGARNLVIIRTADVLIAIDGSYGTLSEIGFALKMGKRVIGLKTWDIPGIEKDDTVEQALDSAFRNAI
ncbi:TIGR00725 family protein [candidate division WOR-3 bacterium JGI_Cruoil_03_51_56]|uniref:TIGR00725 family protein n=1 Tax=candidate division WOR-3 bacterium JGI_Cruoil_03_51_56 TaxID=1973747 RepID=A0A235BRY5_UNCW3|nr:MAG: TIGR00725 family protein [candidate division WOR-3 bacterium JGI_Cruoil_03_51_56]